MADSTAIPVGSQRMPSIPPQGWTDEVRDLFAVYEGEEGRKNGSKYNFTHWFANHPQLATNWMRYNHALTRGVLDPFLREIVIMRVAWRYRSDYEWNLHVQIAAPLGIGPEHHAAIRQGPDAPLWNDLQRLCLRAADALCVDHDIDDDLWAALAARLTSRELMELMFLAGSYTLLAWVLKTVRMPLEDLMG
ncbi:MAG: carboxymuconolactone decarboxylase family protein [Novosphingobium sp.]|jgi:alkylhydroperoxidase family enzyme|nr:carboxymuconolactone decarboxylase family protein [Novosphingobium sp.]